MPADTDPFDVPEERAKMRVLFRSLEAERDARLVAEAAAANRTARRAAAWAAVDVRQARLRVKAAAVAYDSPEYRELVRVGDPEVTALIEAARSI